VKEYLDRTLTYEPDMLNAFLGVLRYAWFLPQPTYHFWGLPFKSRISGNVPVEADILSALFWEPEVASLLDKVSRQDCFPSWTWAEWRGFK
jgi:hypothetical protein